MTEDWEKLMVVNRNQIAEFYGVARTTVDSWAQRMPNFPLPVAKFLGCWVYDKTQIEIFYRSDILKNY